MGVLQSLSRQEVQGNCPQLTATYSALCLRRKCYLPLWQSLCTVWCGHWPSNSFLKKLSLVPEKHSYEKLAFLVLSLEIYIYRLRHIYIPFVKPFVLLRHILIRYLYKIKLRRDVICPVCTENLNFFSADSIIINLIIVDFKCAYTEIFLRG